MMVALTVLAALALQDPTDAMSPAVRQYIATSRPPSHGEVSVETRFSVREAYVGEQVELVTAAWFPRGLRERLRRQPTLKAPALSGLWSASGTELPSLAETRRVGTEVYDLFIAQQSLFPLGPGVIEAPSAVLSYAVPSSVSFFAPEDRKTLASRPVSIRILPIPVALRASLGNGPTARRLHIAWRVPNSMFSASTPFTVELVLTGVGNVTLWPEPRLVWPPGVRVYIEPSREVVGRADGLVSGQKVYRYTLVPDSAGVETLPAVDFPYFDPDRIAVDVAHASPVSIVVQPAVGDRHKRTLVVTADLEVPWATRLVASFWPVLILMASIPVVWLAWQRRRNRPRRHAAPAQVDPTEMLRNALGVSVLPAPTDLELVLRRHGVRKEDAAAASEWMLQRGRARWSESEAEPTDASVITRVSASLKRRGRMISLLLPLLLIAGRTSAQQSVTAEATARYHAGDALGAARLYRAVVDSSPEVPGAWFNLGAARALSGDNPGAVAAWIQGLQLAPRDRALREAMAGTAEVPSGVMQLAPWLPLSKDELLLIALVAWLPVAPLFRSRRRVALGLIALSMSAIGLAAYRYQSEGEPRGLIRTPTPYRVSPTASAPILGALQPWEMVTLERRRIGWALIVTGNGVEGWIPSGQVALLTRLD